MTVFIEFEVYIWQTSYLGKLSAIDWYIKTMYIFENSFAYQLAFDTHGAVPHMTIIVHKLWNSSPWTWNPLGMVGEYQRHKVIVGNKLIAHVYEYIDSSSIALSW